MAWHCCASGSHRRDCSPMAAAGVRRDHLGRTCQEEQSSLGAGGMHYGRRRGESDLRSGRLWRIASGTRLLRHRWALGEPLSRGGDRLAQGGQCRRHYLEARRIPYRPGVRRLRQRQPLRRVHGDLPAAVDQPAAGTAAAEQSHSLDHQGSCHRIRRTGPLRDCDTSAFPRRFRGDRTSHCPACSSVSRPGVHDDYVSDF